MLISEKYQEATAKARDSVSTFVFRTGKDAHSSAGMQTRSAQDDYDRKVELIRRAFREISRLCFEYDYALTAEDWRVLDEARLDDQALSYDQVREQLVGVYKRIKRACIEKGVRHALSPRWKNF